MRNPLSAILQCSDEITSSLTEFKAGDEEAKSNQKLAEILDSSIDAAQTIALCAQHQVNIPFALSATLANQCRIRNVLLMTF
jgi:hypothetical protein